MGIAVVEFGLANWVRLTPEVLALRSRATVLPVTVSALEVGVSRVRITLSLVTVDRVPDLSTTAKAEPTSPLRDAPMLPVLFRVETVAPASISTALEEEFSVEVTLDEIRPSWRSTGATAPDSMWTPIAPAW